MAVVTFYRCHTPHFQGDRFIPHGTLLPEGDPTIIPLYFTAEEVQLPAAKRPTKRKPETPA